VFRRKPTELVAQLLGCSGAAGKEPVQPLVAEHLGQLLGVVGDDRHELQPWGQEVLVSWHRMLPGHPAASSLYLTGIQHH
jgi:hypothetical protein